MSLIVCCRSMGSVTSAVSTPLSWRAPFRKKYSHYITKSLRFLVSTTKSSKSLYTVYMYLCIHILHVYFIDILTMIPFLQLSFCTHTCAKTETEVGWGKKQKLHFEGVCIASVVAHGFRHVTSLSRQNSVIYIYSSTSSCPQKEQAEIRTSTKVKAMLRKPGKGITPHTTLPPPWKQNLKPLNPRTQQPW